MNKQFRTIEKCDKGIEWILLCEYSEHHMKVIEQHLLHNEKGWDMFNNSAYFGSPLEALYMIQNENSISKYLTDERTQEILALIENDDSED